MHTNQLQEQDALCRAQEDRSPVSRSVVSFLQGSETSPVVMPTHPRLERHQAFHSGSVDLESNAGSEGQRGMAETSAHALGINLKLLARGRGVWLTGDVEANRGVSGREEPVLDNRNPRSHRVPHSQMGWLDLFTTPSGDQHLAFSLVILPHLPQEQVMISEERRNSGGGHLPLGLAS